MASFTPIIKAYQERQKPYLYQVNGRDTSTGQEIVKTPDGARLPTTKITNADFKENQVVTVRGSKGYLVSDSRIASDRPIVERETPALIKPTSTLNKNIWTPYNREDDIDRTLKWEVAQDAKWLNRFTAKLTYPGSPAGLGTVGAKNTTKSNNFNLSFEFRIYGSTTQYFADGLSIFYSTSPIGTGGDGGGVPTSGTVFSAYIDTYNNSTNTNDGHPILKIRRVGFSAIDSAFTPELRSEAWQTFSITHVDNKLSIAVAGLTYTDLPTLTDVNADYYFRISASFGASNDVHEVRKIKFSNRKVTRR